MARLTKRTVDAAPLPPAQPGKDTRIWVWDRGEGSLPGFGLRLEASGRRTYFLAYRTVGGRQRKMKLGDHGTITCDEARDLARKALADVTKGGDPVADRRAVRAAPTMSELWTRYLRDHADVKKKPGSVRNDRQLWRDYLAPAFGARKVADVDVAGVQALHARLKATPHTANRALALLSKMLTLAVAWRLRPDNPCGSVPRYREETRRRYLSEAELVALGKALADVQREYAVYWNGDGKPTPETVIEHASVVPALRLLLLTGARLNEVLSLRWEYVDWNRACLHLPDSKTGAKDIPLGAPALQLLRALQTGSKSPWVLPGATHNGHLVNLGASWRRIRVRAGVPDVRLHDLRHSFASVGVGLNASLPVLGALLGHKVAATTARYAHVKNDPARDAADRIGTRIHTLLERHATGDPDNVVPLAQKGTR